MTPGERRRRILESLGGAAHGVGATGATLEVSLAAQESGRIQEATLLVDASFRAHGRQGQPEPRFRAFLDGVQESRVLAYVGVVPIVLGHAAAVIRHRIDRRLSTWGEGARSAEAAFFPFPLVEPSVVDRLVDAGCEAVDTSNESTAAPDVHPQQLLRRAVQAVQRRREQLERDLADQWCDVSQAMLYVDGGLPSSARVLSSRLAIGVIKSHLTLYVAGEALATVMALGAGERSSAFVAETRWRAPVASWYLRLRDARGHDPLWGLVRIEAPLDMLAGDARAANVVADEVSGWVLAESSPLSLPDSRWDTMAYGIRDCEVFLRASRGAG